jgi:hypothetical protein
MIAISNADVTTPQQAAESLRPLIAAGARFSASISGPFGSGKSTALANVVWLAFDLDITLNEIAVFAPDHLAIRHLRRLIGARWPDLDPQTELFAPHLTGLPVDALRGHTALIGDDVPINSADLMRGFVDFLARINDIETPPSAADAAFLDSLKPRLAAAIGADLEARLDPSMPWPRDAYLDAVRDYVADYKERRRLLDLADLVHGDHYVSDNVRLLLLDEIDEPDCALIARCFPNAGIVATGARPRSSDVAIQLPRCLRSPARFDIVDDNPVPQLLPPLADFNSLFILAPRWRLRLWLPWLAQQGIPPPANWSRWRAMVAAWRLDQDQSAFARALNPLLKRAGLAPSDDWLVDPGDVEGWSTWQEIGAADPLTRDHALSVLNRYGQLTALPIVRIARRLRHVEADVVIADASSGWLDDDGEALATSRATRQLIVMKKR